MREVGDERGRDPTGRRLVHRRETLRPLDGHLWHAARRDRARRAPRAFARESPPRQGRPPRARPRALRPRARPLGAPPAHAPRARPGVARRRAGAGAAVPRRRPSARRAPRALPRTRSSTERSGDTRRARPRSRRSGGPRPVSGIVRGSVIMKKRKTRTSGDVTSSHQRSKPAIGPRCHGAVISWPAAASTATPAANVSQNPDRDPHELEAREDLQPAADDQHERERQPHGHRPPPERQRVGVLGPEQDEAEDEAEVRRVEDVPPAERDHVLREERHRGGAGEDPPAVRAPPVPVLGSRHAEDERDAVPRQERARGPHEDAAAGAARSRPRAPRT